MRISGPVGDRWFTSELGQSALPVLGILAIFDLDRFFCVSFARLIPKKKEQRFTRREMIWARALVYAALLEYETGLIVRIWDPAGSLHGWYPWYHTYGIPLIVVFYILALIVWYFVMWGVAASDPGHRMTYPD